MEAHRHIAKMIKEKFPNSTKAERQQMWEAAIKQLYVQVWEEIDRRRAAMGWRIALGNLSAMEAVDKSGAFVGGTPAPAHGRTWLPVLPSRNLL